MFAAEPSNPFYHYPVQTIRDAALPPSSRAWHLGAFDQLEGGSTGVADAHAEDASDAIEELFSAIQAQCAPRIRRVFVTLSQDNYTTSVGGVQLCLKIEEKHAREHGATHINLHPAIPINALSRDQTAQDICLVLTCNGVTLGASSAGEIAHAFKVVAGEVERADLVVHSLLAHSAEAIVGLHRALRPARSFLWLHDFFTLCPSYTLLRNGISYCHAPHVNSSACNLSLFGDERREHETRMRELFAQIPFEVIAPSRFAADFLTEKTNLPMRKLHVQNHCTLKSGSKRAARATGAVRVAFLGHPSPHKGWETFLRLVREMGDDSRYEFHHLGAGRRRDNQTSSPTPPSWKAGRTQWSRPCFVRAW